MSGSYELGAWLRRQREERFWSRAEMARRLIKAADSQGDTTMPSVDDVAHNVYRWERGKAGPSERYRLYYCETLGITPDRFGIPAETAQVGEAGQGDKVIVIMIGLPEGLDARVRITSLKDSVVESKG